jgi:hypothetical protein
MIINFFRRLIMRLQVGEIAWTPVLAVFTSTITLAAAVWLALPVTTIAMTATGLAIVLSILAIRA